VVRVIVIFMASLRQPNGRASNPRVFATVESEAGVPDGSTVDAEGYLWSTHWGGWRIIRYAPDGRVERSGCRSRARPAAPSAARRWKPSSSPAPRSNSRTAAGSKWMTRASPPRPWRGASSPSRRAFGGWLSQCFPDELVLRSRGHTLMANQPDGDEPTRQARPGAGRGACLPLRACAPAPRRAVLQPRHARRRERSFGKTGCLESAGSCHRPPGGP
jgi:hypothetical protein